MHLAHRIIILIQIILLGFPQVGPVSDEPLRRIFISVHDFLNCAPDRLDLHPVRIFNGLGLLVRGVGGN